MSPMLSKKKDCGGRYSTFECKHPSYDPPITPYNLTKKDILKARLNNIVCKRRSFGYIRVMIGVAIITGCYTINAPKTPHPNKILKK